MACLIDAASVGHAELSDASWGADTSHTSHVTGLNFGSIPGLSCSRWPPLRSAHAQSHFRPPALIRYSCLTCRYLSSRNMVTFIRPSTRDQFTDLKVPKLGSLTEIPAQIVIFRIAAPTKSWLEQISEHVSLQRYMQSNQENALIILRQLSSMEWTAQRFLHCLQLWLSSSTRRQNRQNFRYVQSAVGH